MCLCLEIAIQTPLSGENFHNTRLAYEIYSGTPELECASKRTSVARKENLTAGKACIINEFV